ncbi:MULTISPECIES: glycosyltransferase family A protein [unclassified Rhizobium]|jgi:glycosyltransferase involved in cell wall biosynthesis|uniref:glycosyltransferase family A protein n=1 Tax=unclassified Rhizobium TaxID=2613769 RepID=UPI00068EF76D|nr:MULTISPECIES: glycosyltransferase family A protein [unclassified Rhizobium]RKD35495.1 glycosyl transferase family 2 [Rhizobium sp. WW_1]
MLAKSSIASLVRSIAHAEQSGFAVEVLVILDRSETVTRQVISDHSSYQFRIVETDFGDPARARNYAISQAKGKYVAFLDADDLWGVNWLTQATLAAQSRHDAVIWHPEVCVYFGSAHHIFVHLDMEEPDFCPSGLMIENYWTALSFGAREVYLQNSYPETDLKAGFGYEDWAWNMLTISRGVKHKIVSGTGHAIRRREQSVSRDTLSVQAVPRPNPYLVAYLQSKQNRPPPISEAPLDMELADDLS